MLIFRKYTLECFMVFLPFRSFILFTNFAHPNSLSLLLSKDFRFERKRKVRTYIHCPFAGITFNSMHNVLIMIGNYLSIQPLEITISKGRTHYPDQYPLCVWWIIIICVIKVFALFLLNIARAAFTIGQLFCGVIKKGYVRKSFYTKW